MAYLSSSMEEAKQKLRQINNIPIVLAVDEYSERLSFIEGVTTDFPLAGGFAEETALTTAARLLRRLHDASASFVSHYNVRRMSWMLPTLEQVELICHGDFAPYNCAFKHNEVVGIFDFDTCHPAPRIWDLAYSVYCWSPLKSNAQECCAKTLDEQLHRAEYFVMPMVPPMLNARHCLNILVKD